MATIQSKGIFLSLVAQLDKLARHNRQGSFRTKERYYEACKRFCAYLAAEYHLQKLENISGKHLVSYVLYLQDTGKSASTVKTDLAAIRFFHDKMSRPKYTLPTNSELGVELERRRFGQLDRTWSGPEFNRLLGKAMVENRDDFILALYLGRYAGLRIHECFRMDIAAAERALRENALTVKGKGGKVRIVPIEDERILMMLRKLLAQTERGHKLLVPDGMPTDRAINALELFIYRCRNEIGDEGSDRRLTFHGLRHTYAAEKYLTVMRWIVRVPITGVVAALAALNADELAGAGEGGEAQLRQTFHQLGGKEFLLRLDAPLVRVPKVDMQFTAVIHGNLPLLKALTPTVRCLSSEVFL